jgi:hypothetical protein
MIRIDSSKFPFTIFGSESTEMGSGGVTTTNNTIKQIVTETFAEVVDAIKNNLTIDFNNTTQLDGRNIMT